MRRIIKKIAASTTALPYVQSLVGQGIIGGSNGKILPNSPITREAVAKIIFEIR